MPIPSETDQPRIQDFEPRTEKQGIKHKSLHARLRNMAKIKPSVMANLGVQFTKQDDPRSFWIENIPYRSRSERSELDKEVSGTYASHLVTLEIAIKGSPDIIAYHFFNTGQAVKEITYGEQKPIKNPLKPDVPDYNVIDEIITSIEGEDFKPTGTKLG